MKIHFAIPVMASITLTLVACGGGGGSSSSPSSTSGAPVSKDLSSVTATNVTAACAATSSSSVITTPSEGRLLASQCAQCHGTDGQSRSGFDSLAGESRGEIIEEMLEMQSGTDDESEIMRHQALGYSYAQIASIADYFSSLPYSNDHDDYDDGYDDDDHDHDDEHDEDDD